MTKSAPPRRPGNPDAAAASALCRAVASRRWDLAEALLASGASLDGSDSPRLAPRRRALDAAYLAKDPLAMAWCVERGCSLRARDYWQMGEALPTGHAIFDLSTEAGALRAEPAAAWEEDLPFAAGAIPARAPLPAVAAEWDRLREAFLSRAGPEALEESREGETLFEWACVSDAVEWAQPLLALGADPRRTDRFGGSCALRAARMGSARALAMLVGAGADLGARSNAGDTPLASTAASLRRSGEGWERKLGCARILIEAGSDVSALSRGVDWLGAWEAACAGHSWGARAMSEARALSQEAARAAALRRAQPGMRSGVQAESKAMKSASGMGRETP